METSAPIDIDYFIFPEELPLVLREIIDTRKAVTMVWVERELFLYIIVYLPIIYKLKIYKESMYGGWIPHTSIGRQRNVQTKVSCY